MLDMRRFAFVQHLIQHRLNGHDLPVSLPLGIAPTVQEPGQQKGVRFQPAHISIAAVSTSKAEAKMRCLQIVTVKWQGEVIITINLTCRFAQSDGGPTIQSVPESIWPQHHTLTWSCSMAPQQVNNDSTILGKPELQLLQVRRVQAMRARGKDQRNPFQPFAQDCSAMPMVREKAPGYCSGAIHAKLCSHARERGHRAWGRAKCVSEGFIARIKFSVKIVLFQCTSEWILCMNITRNGA
jgi:hypothetical protein